ncbi:ADP-heptose; lipopolysaccharide heptosyltransferase II [Candidatus Blochmanniella floridana]|uniref:lipopolysaccharide heptosyltransferase II n=1 Tax=Blochmanniella floridana TaxID=203907 RepID=Q7VRK5_BLOFL|nr:ADP-heptose; lipopolysaccharide heptosyltransferase II [Candidatus Blochmannia floridanus]
MKILVVSPSWIGDTVISHSLYRLLFKKYQSQVKIDVITSIRCEPIIKRMIEINKIFYVPYKHRVLNLTQCYKLANLLRTENYTQAIILPNSLKSALVPFLAKIPVRTGWRGEMRYGFINDLRILNKSFFPAIIHRYSALAYNKHSIQNFSDLPSPLPLPQLCIQKEEILNVSIKFNLHTKKKIIGLCPGSSKGLFRNWPHYHFVNLAIRLIYYGYHIVILGSNENYLLINDFIEKSKLKKLVQYYDNLLGCTSLDEAVLIIALCSAIVSNDSGLMHVACALHKPVVGLYGITDSCCTPPLFYKSKIIQGNAFKNKIMFSRMKIKKSLYNYHSSLINISVNQVFEVLKELLR